MNREVIWMRTMATNSQLEDMLAERDKLLAENKALKKAQKEVI